MTLQYTVEIGRWQKLWLDVDVEFRLVRSFAEEEHSHPIEKPDRAERIEFDDGCVIEFRKAAWIYP